MLTLHPEYVVDEKQDRKAVILPLSDWTRLIEELEELDDIRAYDEAKADSQETVPFTRAVAEIQTEHSGSYTKSMTISS